MRQNEFHSIQLDSISFNDVRHHNRGIDMSVEYDLCCKDCNKHVWLGSEGFSGRQFPYLMPGLMDTLKDFLWDHQGHHLVWEMSEMHEESEEIEIKEPGDGN